MRIIAVVARRIVRPSTLALPLLPEDSLVENQPIPRSSRVTDVPRAHRQRTGLNVVKRSRANNRERPSKVTRVKRIDRRSVDDRLALVFGGNPWCHATKTISPTLELSRHRVVKEKKNERCSLKLRGKDRSLRWWPNSPRGNGSRWSSSASPILLTRSACLCRRRSIRRRWVKIEGSRCTFFFSSTIELRIRSFFFFVL